MIPWEVLNRLWKAFGHCLEPAAVRRCTEWIEIRHGEKWIITAAVQFGPYHFAGNAAGGQNEDWHLQTIDLFHTFTVALLNVVFVPIVCSCVIATSRMSDEG